MSDTATQAINKLRGDLFAIMRGTVVHADASTAVPVPDATDLASAVNLANACKAALNTHSASVCDPTTGVGAHAAADIVNPVTSPDATGESDLGLLVRATIAAFNAHCERKDVHLSRDGNHLGVYVPRTGSSAE